MTRSEAAGGTAVRVRGFVLPVVLLCLLAVAALAGATLALARRERLADRAAVAAVQARMGAESGIRLGVAALDSTALNQLRREGILQGSPISLQPRVRVGFRIVRIRAEWLWVEGSGLDLRGGLRARRTVGALWWSLEGPTRLSELPAVAEHGGGLRVLPQGTLSAGDAVGSPPGWPEEVCGPLRAVLDSLNPAGMQPAASWTPPATDSSDGLGSIPELGLLDGPTLYRRATIRLPNLRVTPGPDVDAGECRVDNPSNWGAPDRPEGACGDRLPLVVTRRSLEVTGGEGQGILAVGGDLVLDEGARFLGLALVGGSVRIGPESILRGVVRARGRIVVAGLLGGSPCVALRALRARSELSRPLPDPGGGWVPLP